MNDTLITTPIATLRFISRGGDPVDATLKNDGSWASSDRDVADFLNDWYHAASVHSPCRGDFGVQVAELAALALSARLQWHGVYQSRLEGNLEAGNRQDTHRGIH